MELFESNLTPEVEAEFRKWARNNYEVYGPISGVWHPVVQLECVRMNMETGFSPSTYVARGILQEALDIMEAES